MGRQEVGDEFAELVRALDLTTRREDMQVGVRQQAKHRDRHLQRYHFVVAAVHQQ